MPALLYSKRKIGNEEYNKKRKSMTKQETEEMMKQLEKVFNSKNFGCRRT